MKIPKQEGSFLPSVLEPRRRIDKALYAVITEAYVAGVSTRSVHDSVAALGAESGISKSEVSRICADLDETAEAFTGRRLDHIESPLGSRWSLSSMVGSLLSRRNTSRLKPSGVGHDRNPM